MAVSHLKLNEQGLLPLVCPGDVQQAFADYLHDLRKAQKISRRRLAEASGVPESTIKKFEYTGHISFRQLLELWHVLDDSSRLLALLKKPKPRPLSMAELLNSK